MTRIVVQVDYAVQLVNVCIFFPRAVVVSGPECFP